MPDQQRVAEIADYLSDQRDEPVEGATYARVNYWRDKAITAAEALRTHLESGR